MRFELENWLQVCGVASIFHSPNVAISLFVSVNEQKGLQKLGGKTKMHGNEWEGTLLLEATKREPSAATETERMGTPSSGTNSCVHAFAVRSQILILPFWSPEISSPCKGDHIGQEARRREEKRKGKKRRKKRREKR